ncbi:unnamed protein product [Hymenolepis diminuta]|nr:unnamed protein product [Hymenolepis diminuta]
MEDSVDEEEKRDEQAFDEQNNDIDFVYNDADEYGVEIAELYSYSEEDEFMENALAFEETFKSQGKWVDANDQIRRGYVIKLLDILESADRDNRIKAARSLLYLLQGVFKECDLEEDQITWARRNVYLCIECGVLSSVLSLLLLEIRYDDWARNLSSANSDFAANGDPVKKTPVTLVDSTNIRIVVSIIYILVETVRDGCQTANSSNGHSATSTMTKPQSSTIVDHTAKLREQFIEELGAPISNGNCLTIVLFGMVHRFCSGFAPHFPMKKTLLLLWKTVLLTLGPLSSLFELKNRQRRLAKLPELHEDTHIVIRRIRANSPPANPADNILNRPLRNNNRHAAIGQGTQGPHQGSLAGGRLAVQQQIAQQQLQQQLDQRQMQRRWNPSFCQGGSNGDSNLNKDDETLGAVTPRPGSPVRSQESSGDVEETKVVAAARFSHSILSQQLIAGIMNSLSDVKVLPWRPKVRTTDIENFLDNARQKFIGFRVANDMTTLYGLPEPIHEAVKVLKKYHYVSVGEVQIKKEAGYIKYPLLLGKENIPDTPAERLYVAMLPLLPQYMIAILKVLLASAPTSRTKTEPINILAEITPPEAPNNQLQTLIMNYDVNRHREIIVKAISGLLLLLLKHFKLNHIYQFEYISQHLVFANCIPLVLKFFNQNTLLYVQAKNSISCLDFPARVIGEVSQLTPEMLNSDWSPCCWRNMFSCINLLRILNMLTKWKHSRTLMLVVFKSSPILKRALRVRHAMLQLYVLKLLKLQSRYFGRQWRKNNMSVMSAIYQKVRHRLTDDWAYGNEIDTRPWDSQVEESTLRSSIDQFHQRRYYSDCLEADFQPVDNHLSSVLNKPMELPEGFKRNYEMWLEQEVFSTPINWDRVILDDPIANSA